MDRREGLWAVKALAPEVKAETEAPLLAGLGLEERRSRCRVMQLPAHVAEDYRTTGLSLKAHPCALLPPAADQPRRGPDRAAEDHAGRRRASPSAAWC